MTDIRGLQDCLPSLRRYARAICGSQEGGDALCLGALQNLVNQGSFPPGADTRIRVYRALSELWNQPSDQYVANMHLDPEVSAENLVRAMTPRSRQVFLLTSLEGFSPREVMQILDITQETLENMLAIARQQVASQTRTDILIIEDEVFIARDLEQIVQKLGHTVIGKVRTRDAARAFVGDRKPGLILADIQLADGSNGIDAVNDALRLQGNLPVIFITAYPEKLLTGGGREPTFLVSKPFRVNEVQAAISQVLICGSVSSIAFSGMARRIVKFNAQPSA